MQIKIGETTLELVKGNIVQQEVDAIVNAANTGLAGGGGVDGAIHRAGGKSIMEECRTLQGCPTGSAKATSAGNLSAKWVIHAVGPFYSNRAKDPELLASAYRTSLEIAVQKECESIAFPSLSTGAYRYPLHEAAPIALGTIIEFLRSQPHNLKLVRLVLFDDKALTAYEKALRALNTG
ncbi:MAG TPA: O-acetyl-ADP-ribose deacetylase [Abditibacteriaceae bacterium]|jgi:O-acetyl-ADP-ribose deacetylase (regulator of RNase III)